MRFCYFYVVLKAIMCYNEFVCKLRFAIRFVLNKGEVL